MGEKRKEITCLLFDMVCPADSKVATKKVEKTLKV